MNVAIQTVVHISPRGFPVLYDPFSSGCQSQWPGFINIVQAACDNTEDVRLTYQSMGRCFVFVCVANSRRLLAKVAERKLESLGS